MKSEGIDTLADTDLGWFQEARFGLFIHWGLYALAARHEWVKNKEAITTEQYQKYFDHFDPDLYDPAAWARCAKEAGMKYFVITTKHHEGFCLWDSKHTDYKAPNTPYGKDLLRPMVDAFRAEGLRVGFYHSLIDWHHPEYPVDCFHPQRNDEVFCEHSKSKDVGKYADYLHAQVEELLTEFGKIDYIFYDFSLPEHGGKGRDDWRSQELMEMTRRLQPGIIINDRLDLMDAPRGWDVKTPEQVMVRECVKWQGKPVPWETCQTFSGSWGYHRDESTWKSDEQLITMLIDTVSKDGNLLLNVGPTARGTFDDRAKSRMASMGQWLELHGRSIYGCGAAPDAFSVPEGCKLTYNASTNRLYIHVLTWPVNGLYLDGYAGKLQYAQLLNDASELLYQPIPPGHDAASASPDALFLALPMKKPDVTVPVVESFLK